MQLGFNITNITRCEEIQYRWEEYFEGNARKRIYKIINVKVINLLCDVKVRNGVRHLNIIWFKSQMSLLERSGQ